MKTLGRVLTILVMANLLAIALFIGWLVLSDRLDMERVRSIREMLSVTISAEHERELREAAAVAVEEPETLVPRNVSATPPLSAAEELELKLDYSERDLERKRRLRREVEDLQRTLRDERKLLDAEWEKLRAAEAAFDERRRRIAEIEGSEQFTKSVRTYEQLKPDAAAAMLSELLRPPGSVAGGPADEDGLLRVVAYLNAMDPRKRARIVGEFEETDPALAADLLERLGTYGQMADGPESEGG
jgi:flagellar motility protein MotE (MotC chaperone)